MILANLEIEGELRQVIMQAPKNGFFYVLDRKTGEFISAKAYVPINWAKGVDPETGRHIKRPGVLYDSILAEVQPNHTGGHNCQPMAFNHETDYVYFPIHERASAYKGQPGKIISVAGPTTINKGFLLAWDPVKQQEVWRIPLNHWWNGGVLTINSNLVFHGGGDGRFVAYDVVIGKTIWEESLGGGIIGSPVSYKVEGAQYVSVVAGWGGVYGKHGWGCPISPPKEKIHCL